ncbi:hypothetical protein BKA70DRAFT_1296183 [Coprinopsis sp. MPI-PUGE-AT-0042]|nr:hypothetical protein BKA70DRAFT_1296183 [Coprinopsis sp. MPI-PUGE-AT-0042]
MCTSARLVATGLKVLKASSINICANALHQQYGRELSPFESVKACSGCHLVAYCSSHCQKQDWQLRHRKECAIMHQSHLARDKAQRRYHRLCQIVQIHAVIRTLFRPFVIEEMERARKKHGAFITVFDTVQDPPEGYIYKLSLNAYLQKRMRSDCSAMEKRVIGMVKGYHGNAKEREADVWLVDAGFTNGCDEMVAVLMKVEKIEGQWMVVESVPRVLPNARYGLFPDCQSIALDTP